MDLSNIKKKRQGREINKAKRNDSDITAFSKGLFTKEIVLNRLDQKIKFYENLDLLLSSGLDVNSAFDVLKKQNSSRWIRSLTKTISELLGSGLDLAHAIKNEGSLKDFEIAVIRVGEESGNLALVVRLLLEHFRRSKKIKRIILSSISYPLFVLVVSLGVVIFMLTSVVPMFESVFMRFGAELPYLTKVVVSLSSLLRSNFWIFAIVAMVVISLLVFVFRIERIRQELEGIILVLPLVGKIYKRSVCMRFFEMMALQTKSKVSLERALTQSADTSGSMLFRSTLKNAVEKYLQGAPLALTMGESRFFENDHISIIEIGEANNQLDFVFESLASKLREDGEYFTTQISAILEPILIIFVGIVIGVVLIALYLPIFKMSTTMDF